MYIDHTRSVNHPDTARCDGRGGLDNYVIIWGGMCACRHRVKYHCLRVCWVAYTHNHTRLYNTFAEWCVNAGQPRCGMLVTS